MQEEITAFQLCVITRTPVHLWGESGIGKTAVTQALADVLSERYWPVIMSIREPSDQGGLPVLVKDDDLGNSVWMAPPRWAKELVAEGKGIVHLDELNVAPPTVQNSGLRLVNEGWAGDERLPDETSWIACGNPPETNPGVYPLTPAMANRFVHIKFPLVAGEWCDGLIAGWPAPPIVSLRPDWEKEIPRMNAVVAEFIRIMGNDSLHNKPEDATESGRAWRSPRMWTTAARLMAAAIGTGADFEVEDAQEKADDGKVIRFKQLKSRLVRILVEGCVGREGAKEFFTWLVKQDLRNPEEYLADPMGTPIPTRQDQLLVTLSSVAAAALRKDMKVADQQERYRAAWKFLGRIIDMKKSDLCVVSGRVLCINMPPSMEKDLPPEMEKIFPFLDDSDIDYRKQK